MNPPYDQAWKRWWVAVLAVVLVTMTIALGRPLLIVLFVAVAPIGIAISSERRRRWRQGQPVQVPPDLGSTAPPERIGDDIGCSACDAVVPFATMTVSEDGYFCPGCARARVT